MRANSVIYKEWGETGEKNWSSKRVNETAYRLQGKAAIKLNFSNLLKTSVPLSLFIVY